MRALVVQRGIVYCDLVSEAIANRPDVAYTRGPGAVELIRQKTDPILLVTGDVVDGFLGSEHLSGDLLAEITGECRQRSIFLLHTVMPHRGDGFSGKVVKSPRMLGETQNQTHQRWLNGLLAVVDAYQVGMTIDQLEAACPDIIERL